MAIDSLCWFIYKVKEIFAKQVEGKKKVITHLAKGHTETINIAERGDWVVRNLTGEKYVISGKKFFTLYQAIPGDKNRYVPQGKNVRAIQINDNVAFTAPWGSKQIMLIGDWLIDTGDKRYGIGALEFHDTYGSCLITKEHKDDLTQKPVKGRDSAAHAVFFN